MLEENKQKRFSSHSSLNFCCQGDWELKAALLCVSILTSLIVGRGGALPVGIMKLFTKMFTYEYEILTFIMVNEIFIYEFEMWPYEYVMCQFPQMPAYIHCWCRSTVSYGRQHVWASFLPKQIMPIRAHSSQEWVTIATLWPSESLVFSQLSILWRNRNNSWKSSRSR